MATSKKDEFCVVSMTGTDVVLNLDSSDDEHDFEVTGLKRQSVILDFDMEKEFSDFESGNEEQPVVCKPKYKVDPDKEKAPVLNESTQSLKTLMEKVAILEKTNSVLLKQLIHEKLPEQEKPISKAHTKEAQIPVVSVQKNEVCIIDVSEKVTQEPAENSVKNDQYIEDVSGKITPGPIEQTLKNDNVGDESRKTTQSPIKNTLENDNYAADALGKITQRFEENTMKNDNQIANKPVKMTQKSVANSTKDGAKFTKNMAENETGKETQVFGEGKPISKDERNGMVNASDVIMTPKPKENCALPNGKYIKTSLEKSLDLPASSPMENVDKHLSKTTHNAKINLPSSNNKPGIASKNLMKATNTVNRSSPKDKSEIENGKEENEIETKVSTSNDQSKNIITSVKNKWYHSSHEIHQIEAEKDFRSEARAYEINFVIKSVIFEQEDIAEFIKKSERLLRTVRYQRIASIRAPVSNIYVLLHIILAVIFGAFLYILVPTTIFILSLVAALIFTSVRVWNFELLKSVVRIDYVLQRRFWRFYVRIDGETGSVSALTRKDPDSTTLHPLHCCERCWRVKKVRITQI